jgi:hypothetical protein
MLDWLELNVRITNENVSTSDNCDTLHLGVIRGGGAGADLG